MLIISNYIDCWQRPIDLVRVKVGPNQINLEDLKLMHLTLRLLGYHYHMHQQRNILSRNLDQLQFLML